jgi:hypothetical protein
MMQYLLYCSMYMYVSLGQILVVSYIILSISVDVSFLFAVIRTLLYCSAKFIMFILTLIPVTTGTV